MTNCWFDVGDRNPVIQGNNLIVIQVVPISPRMKGLPLFCSLPHHHKPGARFGYTHDQLFQEVLKMRKLSLKYNALTPYVVLEPLGTPPN